MMSRPGSMLGKGPGRGLKRRRDLMPARGIARGVMLGALLWLVLLALWFV
jgi:hypothetical protein